MYVEHVIYVGDLDPPEAGTLFTLNTLFTLGAGPAATYRRGALFTLRPLAILPPVR